MQKAMNNTAMKENGNKIILELNILRVFNILLTFVLRKILRTKLDCIGIQVLELENYKGFFSLFQ